LSDWTIDGLNAALAAGETTCAEIVEAGLARVKSARGEGKWIFRSLRENAARNEAVEEDLLRTSGAAAAPLAGLPISIKDNIDIAG
jgi:amidase